MSFVKRLTQAMNEKGISQKELGVQIGKSKSSVSGYLSGANIPKQNVQEKIAEVLDCTVEFLNSEIPEEEAPVDLRRVSVETAAKRLGKSPQFVRVALQNKAVSFGAAVKVQNRWSYHISPKLFDEYIGEGGN